MYTHCTAVWCPQSEQNKTSPPYSFVNIYFFWKKNTWVTAECRDASKNTLRNVGGLAHKKLGSYLCLAPYSHHTNWLSIQSPYKLADRFKIHTIVRFDTWNFMIHHTDPISGGRAVKPAVQKANNKWSVLCTFWENCRGVWRAGQKLRSWTKDQHFPVKPPP